MRVTNGGYGNATEHKKRRRNMRAGHTHGMPLNDNPLVDALLNIVEEHARNVMAMLHEHDVDQTTRRRANLRNNTVMYKPDIKA